MTSRDARLLWLIFLFALTAFVVESVYADPTDADADKSRSLPDAIKPGMTNAEVTRLVRKVRPGDGLSDCWSVKRSGITARYPLGNGAYLVLEFRKVADRLGNLGDHDKVSTVRLLHFDDLKRHVPDELFQAVRLVHLSPSVNGDEFDPISLIRAVNGLYPLGKEKALKTLRAYDALCNEDEDRRFEYDLDEQRIFLVLRLLFVRKDGDARMPWMSIGGTTPTVEPENKDWPLFPLAVQNDIPFCLSPGYALAGQAEPPSSHMDYCEKNCVLRKSPLCPSASPLQAIRSICGSERWHRLFATGEDGKYTEYLLRLQSLSAVSNITRKPRDMEGFCPSCVSRKDADKAWEQYSGDFRLMNATWDADHQQFVENRAGAEKR